ncbi:uncharacterized protein TRIREDRAFT_54426 [Trichoderma reesei QM6a]|uniref:Predicted protein n=2 Tax=Hypocrea jecorina TaxID=51453 RepID=G0R8E3_HYPJQ|nr:uncharacterized protein TRIREDRAFT_54426 [Trichoderma reesei QM6a]EGR52866.1 predicted protein [Trichoderma reesei QM6a]ETS06644.1 hypothetical protein M419DRAFT_31946 [Trichoderma reesei RUT C-30]
MHSSTWTSLLLLGLANLVPDASARPSACPPPVKPGKAIYTITNEKQNSVIALPIGSDGLLYQGTSTPTGGSGSNALTASGKTTAPAAPDALVSQSALTVVGNNLFAVNAGSNTVTMFAIDPKNPTRLTMLGKPIAIPGDFPTTVAASAKNQLVCVGATGAKSGISCAPFSSRGIGKMDQLRPIGLNQTTPPVGPPNTISQVFFSADEETLFATVKGDPTANTKGVLGVFGVEPPCNGRGAATVSEEGKLTQVDGSIVLFGSSAIQGSSDLFVTDAAFGAAVLSVDAKTGAASIKGKATIDGQGATCWAAISPETNTAFVTDVAVNRIVEVSLTDASIQSITDLNNGDPGLIDIRAAGSFVYALSPGNGTTLPAVTVMDVVTKKQVQHFQLKGLGASKNAQGVAVLL